MPARSNWLRLRGAEPQHCIFSEDSQIRTFLCGIVQNRNTGTVDKKAKLCRVCAAEARRR